ncbi:hypothetical protein [Candidatus Tisiphia endosymbiont of Psammoecus bipunctatus]
MRIHDIFKKQFFKVEEYILLVNEELIDEDQNHEVLGVKGSRSGAYI